jgi:hypothetical protein
MTPRLKFGLIAILICSLYLNVRLYQAVKKQKQIITDFISVVIQYDNALRSCQNPVSTPRINTTEYNSQ